MISVVCGAAVVVIVVAVVLVAFLLSLFRTSLQTYRLVRAVTWKPCGPVLIHPVETYPAKDTEQNVADQALL